ncbi:MAG: phenylalanine--tRNA ligase subunit beta [Gammaproteobacteria bacterium]
MKVSEQWLREWVNPSLDSEQLAEQLTMLGHEVDAIEPVTTAAGQPANDNTLDVAITPNRGDCLSIQGLARELAAANRLTVSIPDMAPVAAQSKSDRGIKVQEPEACPRYLGRVIEEVDVTCPSPDWLQEKLHRCGIRSLGPVVDVTNYVMLELGQPMHAFDNDRLSGNIGVRYAAADEALRLLDGGQYVLPAGALLITDDSGAIAMAGVMGGEATAVTDGTRNIFLESAFFTPRAIAGRARQLGLHSDASHRFERGVDPQLPGLAIQRATALLLDICGGKPGPVTEAVSKSHLPAPVSIELEFAHLQSLLGEPVDGRDISNIIAGLGIDITADNKKRIKTRIPARRFDLRIAEDLIEEVARIHGYDKFPGVLPHIGLGMRQAGRSARLQDGCRVLAERGFQEVISYSFVDKTLQQQLFPQQAAIELLNPIAPELATMRLSLWPGLLRTLLYNVNRQQARVRIFETGQVFTPQPSLQQEQKLAGLIYGNVYAEQWDNPTTAGDIFDLKADVEAVLGACCGTAGVGYGPLSSAALHPGQATAILLEGREAGVLGRLHPAIQQALELSGEVYLFELDVAKLPPKKVAKYLKISRFPLMRRDISVIVDENITIHQIQDCIKKSAGGILTNLELFDLYQGEGIDLGQKSVSFGLTFQRNSSTLTDEEVEGIREAVIEALRNEFNALLRE